mgnify:FL=1
MEYIKIPANALDQIENKAELVLFGLYYSQISRGQMENYFTQEYVYDILKMNSRTFTAGIKSLYDKELLRWGWGRRDGAEYWARKVMPDKLYWDIEEANSNYLAMQTWWAGKLRLPYNALVFLSAFNSQARKEGKLGEDYSFAPDKLENIASVFNMSRSTLTNTLSLLEELGILTRKRVVGQGVSITVNGLFLQQEAPTAQQTAELIYSIMPENSLIKEAITFEKSDSWYCEYEETLHPTNKNMDSTKLQLVKSWLRSLKRSCNDVFMALVDIMRPCVNMITIPLRSTQEKMALAGVPTEFYDEPVQVQNVSHETFSTEDDSSEEPVTSYIGWFEIIKYQGKRYAEIPTEGTEGNLHMSLVEIPDLVEDQDDYEDWYSYAERGESDLWVKKTEELDREMLEEELKYPGGHGNAFRRKHGLPEIDMSYNPYDIEADEDAQALGIHWIGEEKSDD